MTRIWWEATLGAENISVNETLQSQTKHCKGLVSRRNQLLATSSLLDFQFCSFLGRIGRKRDTARQRTRCYWLTNLVLKPRDCNAGRASVPGSIFYLLGSDIISEHCTAGIYKLRKYFSSNFLLALGPQVETWEIDLNFSIDFRPLDEWCELWRSDGFSPFIKSIPCCLDDCCMSLGWSQCVSWMVTVCLLDGHSMSHPTYGRTTMGDVGMDQLPLHQMAFLLIAQCWDKH